MSDPYHPTVGDYRRMISHLRDAVATEFPERAADIYLMDASRPQAEELARAAAFLHVPDLEARIKKAEPQAFNNGLALPIIVGDRSVWVTFGRPGMPDDPTAPLETSDFYMRAKTAIHETGHALMEPDAAHAQQDMPFIEGMSVLRSRESGAELFAVEVMNRNGLSMPGDADHVMASYDARKFEMPFDHYDPSPAYAQLKTTAQPTPYDPAHFAGFNHLRDSFRRTMALNDANHLRGADALAYAANDSVLQFTLESLQQRNMSEPQIIEWLDARSAIFPRNATSANAQNYLQDFTTRWREYETNHVPVGERSYPPYAPHFEPLSLEKSAAAAWLQQARTHDPIDIAVAQQLLGGLLSADKMQYVPEQGLSDKQEQQLLADTGHVAWAEAVLHGKSFVAAVQGLKPLHPQAAEATAGAHLAPNPPSSPSTASPNRQ